MFGAQFKVKISVFRNAGVSQSIVAMSLSTSNLEQEAMFSMNGRNTLAVYT